MQRRSFRRRALLGLAGTVVSVALVVPAAFARSNMSPMVMGNATAGKALFAANCAVCHTLAAAGSKGTIGPNLNTLSLTEATIIKQVTDGGKSLMGKAAAKYAVSMPSFRGKLSTAKIEDVAAFVYDSTHK